MLVFTRLDSKMSNQKKIKLDKGQQRLGFGSSSSGLKVRRPPTDCNDPSCSSGGESTAKHHAGSLESWRSFAQPRYTKKHPWLVLKLDGIYCQYCSLYRPHVQSGAAVFVSSTFTGNRSDKLLQHELCASHLESETSYKESRLRTATGTTIAEVVRDSAVITADEEAFIDALRCMYFLLKREIAHTTNFSELQSLCILLGNTTLLLLRKAKSLNYLPKQTMGEMVAAIGLAVEAKILNEVRESKFFSIITVFP